MSNAESRNWREIFQQEFVFDRRYRQVEYIEDVGKADLVAFFCDKYLDRTKQKKFIVEVNSWIGGGWLVTGVCVLRSGRCQGEERDDALRGPLRHAADVSQCRGGHGAQ